MPVNQSEIGILRHSCRTFGCSVGNIPLKIYEPETGSASILLLGAMHGDENLGSILLSECLRKLQAEELKAAVILSVNPDGILAGTRGNANGVDLNRNYPTANWQADPVFYRNRPDEPQNIALRPGAEPASEPETQALIKLIHNLTPRLIVSFHGFLACVDDPLALDISKDIADRTNMELVADVGYETPGSFGSWCSEQHIPIITYELPSMGKIELSSIHEPIITDLLTGSYDEMIP